MKSEPCSLSLGEKARSKGRPSKGGPRQGASCAICGKSFNNSSALAKHKLTHSDERKYVCPICSKAFKRQDHLNGHMMTHRSKKPFECKFEGCDKSYCDARSLRRHLENQHQHDLEATSYGSEQGQYFQFDAAHRQQFLNGQAASAGDKSPGYLGQVSPISPAVQPVSPGLSLPQQRSMWKGGTNPLDEPKPVQCKVCSRRFKNMPALNGHMRLHGGYYKDKSPEKELDDCEPGKKLSPATSSTLSTVRQVLQANKVSSASGALIVIKPELSKAPSSSSSVSSTSSSESPLSGALARERLCQPANNPVLAHLRQQQLQAVSQQQLLQEFQQQHSTLYSQASTESLSSVHSPSYTDPQQSCNFSDANFVSAQEAAAAATFCQQAQSHGNQPQSHGNTDSLFAVNNGLSQQALLRRIPPPLHPSSSCPSTPNHPLTPITPNHPVTPHVPSHPNTPNHPQTPNPALTPANNQTPNHPLTPHTPGHLGHAASLPCTPSHPLTPTHSHTPNSHQSRHFHFPPSEPLQEATSYALRQQQLQQHLEFPQQQQQQQQQQQFSQQHQQQQQQQQQQLQQIQQLQLEEMQQHQQMQMQKQLEALQADQQIREITEKLQRQEEQQLQQQQLQQELQDLTDDFQHHHLQQQLQQNNMMDPDLLDTLHMEQQQAKNAMGTASITTSSTSTSSTQQSNKSHNTDELFKPIHNPSNDTAFQQERKRRASADPDKFTQPKRPYVIDSDTLSNGKKKVAFWNKGDGSKELAKVTEEPTKSETDDTNTFRSPNDVAPSAGGKRSGKKKHRPEPLIIPAHVNHFGFASRLRSPRLAVFPWRNTGSTPPPYTPPPMLSPARSGSGLFWTIHHGPYGPITPKSAPVFARPMLTRRQSVAIPDSAGGGSSTSVSEETEDEEIDPPPETDIQPHVNIGPQYQAELPDYQNEAGSKSALLESDREWLMWSPSVMEHLSDDDVLHYQDFACCATIPGNGTNKEYALHLLFLCHGNIKKTMLRLMQGDHNFPNQHALHSYKYQESDSWSAGEVEAYHQALMKFDKDFFNIATDVASKNVKQCVQFYYLWKKVCSDEYKRLRIIRRKREQDELYNLRSRQQVDDKLSNGVSPKPVNGEKDSLFSCTVAGCSAAFSSRQALSCHMRIHTTSHSREPSPKRPSGTPSPAPSNVSNLSEDEAAFPCKICGIVFSKVKSRSAHMKRHKAELERGASPRPPPPLVTFTERV